VSREVKIAWSEAFSAKQQMHLFEKLDSLYSRLEKAVNLRYEVEAISRLEMLTAKNRISEIKIEKQQAQNDYKIALQKLNLWLGEKTVYTVPDDFEGAVIPEEDFEVEKGHPLLETSKQQVAVAQARLSVERADFLPDINLQYGLQKVNGATGFYSYQAGLSIPILSGREYGEVKVAKIEKEMAMEAAEFQEEQIKSDFSGTLQNYKKWKASWEFYRDEVLPLLEEQRQGSLLAFNEGAIEYVAFIQNLDNAVQSELKALEAYENFQIALAEIQFYLND
jgi:cobalt-zinc-cadmium resistance protein CzcA